MKISEESTKIIITWRKDDPEDIEEAKGCFINFTRQGWLAARRNGELRRVLEFKPEYGELWFIPFSEGG